MEFGPQSEFTRFVDYDSVTITDALGQRNTAEFSTNDDSGRYALKQGEQVVFTAADGETRLFAGTVQHTEAQITQGTRNLRTTVRCVDFTEILSRRRIARSYSNQTLRDIVEDILGTFYASDGLTVTMPDDGPLIKKAVFSYQQGDQVMEELAELTGYHWWVDYYKVLHFTARENDRAPFAVSEAPGAPGWSDLRVTRHRDHYRNRQLIRAGQDLTAERLETFTGDGSSRVFETRYPIGTKPSIQIGVDTKDVKIRGLESGGDWYWSKGEKELSQDFDAAPLAPGQMMTVRYRGLFPVVVQLDDPEEIAKRAEVQGDSGVYEEALQDAAIESVDLALQKAEGMLRRYGRINHSVAFAVDGEANPLAAGLRAGQLITLELPSHELTGDYLIESVRITTRGDVLKYHVKAVSGEAFGGWVKFYRDLAAQQGGFAIREDELLTIAKSVTEQVTLGDDLEGRVQVDPVFRFNQSPLSFSELS